MMQLLHLNEVVDLDNQRSRLKHTLSEVDFMAVHNATVHGQDGDGLFVLELNGDQARDLLNARLDAIESKLQHLGVELPPQWEAST